MKERIARLAGGTPGLTAVLVSTFHAFGLKLVREEHEKLGLPAKFAVPTPETRRPWRSGLLREVKVDDKRFDVGRLVAILSRLRSGGAPGHPDDEYELCAGELLPRYALGLRAMGAVDFDDLLNLPLTLVAAAPRCLPTTVARYRYDWSTVADTTAAQLGCGRFSRSSKSTAPMARRPSAYLGSSSPAQSSYSSSG